MNTLQLNKKGVNGRTLNVVGLDGRSVSFPLRTPDSEPTSPYIKFADPEVKRICVENWGSDGEITESQAAAVTSIGTAFKDNTTITSFNELRYFTGLTSFSNNAFDGCVNLNSIIIPSQITILPEFLFYNCTTLTNVGSLDNIISIERNVFYKCTALVQDINVPKLTTLGYRAFSYSGITAFRADILTVLPDAPNNIDGVFENCPNLTTVELPSCEVVGNRSFVYCDALIDVRGWESFIEIRQYSFYKCTALVQDINVPKLTTLGYRAFSYSGITAFRADALTATNVARDNVDGDFENCPNLTTVELPSCEVVGDATFRKCTALTNISFNNITSIGRLSFRYCSELPFIILSDTITTISYQVWQECSKLTTFVVKAITPPELGVNNFASTPIASGTGSIYVPDGTTTDAESNTITIVEAYKAATNWSTYASRIFPISQLETDNPELYAEIEEYL